MKLDIVHILPGAIAPIAPSLRQLPLTHKSDLLLKRQGIEFPGTIPVLEGRESIGDGRWP